MRGWLVSGVVYHLWIDRAAPRHCVAVLPGSARILLVCGSVRPLRFRHVRDVAVVAADWRGMADRTVSELRTAAQSGALPFAVMEQALKTLDTALQSEGTAQMLHISSQDAQHGWTFWGTVRSRL